MVKTLRGSQQGTVGGGDAERVQLVFSDEAADTGRRLRFIDVEVTANDNVNPNAAGRRSRSRCASSKPIARGGCPTGLAMVPLAARRRRRKGR